MVPDAASGACRGYDRVHGGRDRGGRGGAGAAARRRHLAGWCRWCCWRPSTRPTASPAPPPSCPTRSSPSSTWSPRCSRWAGIVFAGRPADRNHPYGHGKIEFFSAAFEGGLIAFAAVLIVYEVVLSLLRGVEVRALDAGARPSCWARASSTSLLGWYLVRTGRRACLAHPRGRRPARARGLLDQRGHRRRPAPRPVHRDRVARPAGGRRSWRLNLLWTGLPARAPRRGRAARRGGHRPPGPAARGPAARTWARA